MPGDELVFNCYFNTMDRDDTTYGGVGTEDEMCMVFIYYYPAADFVQCADMWSIGYPVAYCPKHSELVEEGYEYDKQYITGWTNN